ncbi:MAG: NAD(+) synthase [Cytophagaceae bacterium]
MTYLKLAGAALNQTPIDWENNKTNILQAIYKARQENVHILCLPELCITGYGCEDLFLSTWVCKKSLAILNEIIPETGEICVALNLPVQVDGKIYNASCLIHDKKVLGFYAKQFLANDGVHYEPRWFSPWKSKKVITYTFNEVAYNFGDITFDVLGIKIGFEICEDAWQTNEIRPACSHMEKGVSLILNPSASHFAFGKSDFRYNLIKKSSENFNCTYLYANLLGNEAGRMIYDGEVLIARKGQLLQRNNRFSFNDVDLVSSEVNFDNDEVRHQDLKPDYREKEYEFKEAITLALFDYMRKSRSQGFVLSLSGGADSSACAIAVAEMIKKGCRLLGTESFLKKGKINKPTFHEIKDLTQEQQIRHITSELLTCAYQSTKNSGDKTFKAAKDLAESIGATFYHWSVNEEVEGYIKKVENALDRKLTWEKDDIALQNIQARSRSPIIWMFANIKKALLITTSNRSEGDVGYATMDGDTSGSIAPIAGVDKHFIRSWLLWAEEELAYTGLKYVNSLAPTAELRPPDQIQTDEADLMPYDVLREIEFLAIPEGKSPKEALIRLQEQRPADNLEKLTGYVIKFYRLWAINQWKRERLAPSFHMDAFNIDPRSWYRFPILSGGFSEEIRELEQMLKK